ncbi:MAG: acyltransferase [Dehalococcoidia bacterium]
MSFRVHPTAEVSDRARIGEGASIWHQAQVRENAGIGPGCIIGKGVYIGADVQVGANCKVQNYSCVYEGTTLEDGVFVGPEVVFTNDRFPRAINPDGSLKSASDWECVGATVQYGAAVGSRSVVLPGVRIGRWALVGAGSVVTKDVPAHGLVIGNPARQVGWVCQCARRLNDDLGCAECGRRYQHTADGLAILES